MKTMSKIVPRKDVEPDRLPGDGPLIEIGQWYWLKMYEQDKEERIACVTLIGSNFVELHDPYGHNNRVHLDEFDKKCRRETNPEAVICGQMEHYRGVVREKLGEIKALTARLGVTNHFKLEENPAVESSRALSVLSGTPDLKKYKKSLILAKDKELPALFKEVEEAHSNLVVWMKAQTLGMQGAVNSMKDCIEEIEDRVFNVSLYAGLTEEVVEVQKGAPADIGEKLRLMQRLLYMDEECLLNYKHGGMKFEHLPEFDRWIKKPENMARIFRFPRCIVAFRVRRERAQYDDWDGTIEQIMVRFREEELNKLTFLYIRNGQRLYRLNCDLEFDDLIFPGKDELNLDEPMMARMFCSRVEEIVTKRHFEDLVKEHEEKNRKMKEWEKANPGKRWIDRPREFDSRFELDRYEPFNKSSVYYDEIKETIEKRVKYYNRIALIIQGLFDRSEVLHPHPPVRLWSPEGFSAAVELVYDGSNLIHYGEAPDFEAYRRACNASLKEGSITVGQDNFWSVREAKKESSRMDRDWRVKGYWRPSHFRPYGDPGPGYLAKVVRWTPRSRKAVFRWMRKRRAPDYWKNQSYKDLIPAVVEVPDTELFNVSAYKPGDFKQFFVDPRTRAQYLKWAPLLLAAEDYHAGKAKVGSSMEAE